MLDDSDDLYRPVPKPNSAIRCSNCSWNETNFNYNGNWLYVRTYVRVALVPCPRSQYGHNYYSGIHIRAVGSIFNTFGQAVFCGEGESVEMRANRVR